ncbi:mucin-17-like [Portunus trituberculatus]|uniref:mucin-17-like n=1 Tax=Portunus trituberculatus TaxID=210409 RepID=UPI001E1D064E|nr:mucin-17-like [Portunus trituberculatus]
MRRPKTLIHPLLLLPIFLLLASSHGSGLEATQEGDSSFVVFSSFPTFSPEGDGTQGSTSHAVPGAVKRESGHDGSSASPHGVPLSISEVEGLSNDRDITTSQDDTPNTGIFLFTTLMKDKQHQTISDAEDSATTVAADDSTTLFDMTMTEPTVAPVVIQAESVPLTPSSAIVAKSPERPREKESNMDKLHDSNSQSQPDETAQAEVSVSVGSLASRLQGLRPNPRHTTRAVQEREEKEENFSQQMTLAERLKALQARRAQRFGSLARRDRGQLRRENLRPKNTDDAVQRRRGNLAAARASEDETRQKTFSVSIEPKDVFISPMPEKDNEGERGIKETHDLVGEESTLSHTTPEQAKSTFSPATSAPSSSNNKKLQRKSYAERLRERLQKRRERNRNATLERLRNSRPNSTARPQTPRRPKPEDNNQSETLPRNNNPRLTAGQRRRQELLKRLKHRSSTPRPPGPLSLREKFDQLQNRNRFIPTSKPKQTTLTTTSTTTDIPLSTTPITMTQPTTTIRTTPALVFTTWPITQESATTTPITTSTTPQRVTTIRTTPSLAFTTWPATQESDDDNFLVTVPSTTEADEDSRRSQIRLMIDAMLNSKGLSGTTTTEQVLSFLEQVTSRPIFTETTESLRSVTTERSSHSRPTFSFAASAGKEGRPSVTHPRDRPTLFQHFPSLADKLAGSHSPKKSKFHPTPPAASDTPVTSTHENKTSTNNRRIISLSDLLAGGNNVRASAELPHRTAEETNTDSTTIISEVETSSSAGMTTVGTEMDILPTTQLSMEKTTTEDERVKDLISKLLAQGVITMPAPSDSDTVTSGMEGDQSTTTIPDTSFGLEDTQAPPRESIKTFELDPHMSTETDKSQTQSDFMPPLHSEEPQLTRGAPRRRPPILSTSSSTDSPLVSLDDVMDTTIRLNTDITEVTEIPPITTTSDTILHTSSPHIQEESTLPDTGDLGENEIDIVNSKDNLQSLIRGFVIPSVRPELAAVNHVLGFSFTTDDVVDLVEVNIEKPQVPDDSDTLFDDMETAATEQVMITTSFYQNDDLTPTPLNLDVTSLSVSESSPQIHSTTEATDLSRETATSHFPTVTVTQPAGDEMTMFTEESNPSDDLELGTTEPISAITTSHQIITESSTIQTSSTPDAIVFLANETPSTDKGSTPNSVSADNQDSLIPKPQQPESDNVTASLQKLLRQGALDKADALLNDSTGAFHGVSEAVMRERLHLLKLVKERKDSKLNHEQLRPTSKSPTITSRFSLSELLLKKTSGEMTESEVTLKPSLSSLQPKEETEVTTEALEPHSVVRTTVIEETQKDTTNRAKTSDAMKRFLELNRHALQALRAKNKATSTTKASTLSTTTSTTPATLQTIPNLTSELTESDSQGNFPVISEVTPQSQVIASDIPEETGQPREETKERPSLLLRPVLLRPQKSEISTQETPRSHIPSTVSPISASLDEISHPPMPTQRSRIPPPFRLRRPHPPTKFSITRQQQQADSPLPKKTSEDAVESQKVKVPITIRPLLHPASIPNTSDASITTGMIKTDDPNKDLDMVRTTLGFQSAEAQTERPDDERFTTLASLLKRKQTSSTKFNHGKPKTTLLPKTTTDSTPEVTIQPDNETLPPVTLPEQEEVTTQQLFDENQPKSVPQDDHNISLRPASVRGTFLATEGMTAEHVPPPFNFHNKNTDFQTRLHGTSNGAFNHGVTSFNAPPGVPLPFPVTSAPKAVFPTTAPAITFEPTSIPSGFPTKEEGHDLDASTTTDSPLSFPTNPLDFEIPTETPSPPKLTFDMDRSTSPLGFNFQLHRKSSTTDGGALTTGSDTHQSKPLQVLFSTTTEGTRLPTFTLGQNEAFFTDDNAKETPIIIPVTEIPLVTTPITTATPRVILLTLPVANGSVTADSLLPETTSFQEESSVPSTTTFTSSTNRKNLHPKESLAPPPDIMHMITKGVTITSTEGIIDRVLSHHESVPQPPPPPHSLTFSLPTNPTVLHPDQNPPESVFQTEAETLSIRIQSESLLKNKEEKNLQGVGTLRQQQHGVLDTVRPNLQGGHLNLNELRQRQLGGKVTAEVSHGSHASSGLQEQQTHNQMILGQTNAPRQQIFQEGQSVTGQQIFHSLQKPSSEQKVISGQHNIEQHVAEEGRVKSIQEGQIIPDQLNVEVTQRHKEGQSDQHTVDNQHIHTQGQELPGQQVVHQHAIEQRKGPAEGHNPQQQHSLKQAQGGSFQFDALNQDTVVQSEANLDEHKITTHQNPADEQLTLHQPTTVQGHGVPLEQVIEVQSVLHRLEQEQGKLSQHAQQPEKHFDQNLQDQQDSQGQHDVQGQNIQTQHNLQSKVIQAQPNPQGHIITIQANPQDQHNQQGQHILQEHTAQDQHNFQSDLIHGQHNQEGQHNIQGQIIQDQHKQDQHSIQGDIFQDQHNQNQHSIQKEMTEDQQNQDQHNIQGKIIQVQHDQDEHNIQGQIIGDQHNQDQHNIQRQIIQVQHNQGQQDHTQDQPNQGQHNIQVQHNQDQHNTQEQITQDHHKQGQHKEDQHNIQVQTIQTEHDQDQHNTQGQVIQDQDNQGQHNLQGHNQQSTQGLVIHSQQNSQDQHNFQGQTTQDQHHQQGHPDGQTHITQGQSKIQEEIHNQHQPQAQSTQPQRTPERQTPSTHGRQEQPSSQPQREQPQRSEHTTKEQEQRDQGQSEVSRGQATPKQPTQTHQKIFRGGQTSTASQNQHQRQHDGRQQTTEEAQRQPQPNSRRGKFISGDAVQGVQRVVVGKQSSRGRVRVQDALGSGGTIIRGQSVVPPVKTKQTSNTRFRPQQQKVQVETRRGLAAEGSPQGPPRNAPAHRGSIGHFNNLAAGFIRGPANSFITGFPSQEPENTTSGNDGDVPVTILPEAFKEARRGLPLSQDPDGDEIPGQAGIDYPIRTNIPVTSFICSPAMANRMFADPDTSCQVYHVCSGDHKFSFLCPKGTLFNQDTSVCQWWFTVDCDRQARRLAEVRALG